MKYKSFYAITASSLLTLSAQLGAAAEFNTKLVAAASAVTPSSAKEIEVKKSPFFPQNTQAKDSAKTGLESRDLKKNAFQLDSSIDAKASKRGGGADTGGGNGIGSPKADPLQIAKFLSKSKKPALYILRRIEFISESIDQDGIFALIGKKLFGARKSIYQSLDEVELQALKQGPCLDSAGAEVDASAKDFPKICFSLERLASRLNEDAVQGEILALVIHEISHSVGTTENEAILLQHMVKSSLANDPYQKIQSLVEAYRRKANDELENVSYLLENLTSLSSQERCTMLPMLSSGLNTLMQKNMTSLSDEEKNGISFSASPQIWALQGAVLKSINLMSSCLPNNPNYLKIGRAFQGRSQMKLLDFFNALYSPDTMNGGRVGPLPENLMIRRLNEGNLDAVRLELLDIQSILSEVLNHL